MAHFFLYVKSCVILQKKSKSKTRNILFAFDFHFLKIHAIHNTNVHVTLLQLFEMLLLSVCKKKKIFFFLVMFISAHHGFIIIKEFILKIYFNQIQLFVHESNFFFVSFKTFLLLLKKKNVCMGECKINIEWSWFLSFCLILHFFLFCNNYYYYFKNKTLPLSLSILFVVQLFKCIKIYNLRKNNNNKKIYLQRKKYYKIQIERKKY